MTRPLEIAVSCRAGHRGEERPVAFRFGDREISVETILDSWLAPEHRYFKIRAEDRAIYILRHDVNEGFWELCFYTLAEAWDKTQRPEENRSRKR
ncbi:MAG: hypothetical protein AB1921_19100 [Thermodesulfobacteriota bacterium]